MSFTRCVVLAVAVGCGLTAMGASRGDDKPRAPDDAAIKAVVAYLAKNGVKLEAGKRGDWVVADPKGDGYEVIVHLLTFPAKATEEEMQAELKPINLAFMLNAPARVAMSVPGLRAANPAKKLPPLDQVPVVAKLEKLFKDYKPPEPVAANERPRRDPLYSQLPDAIRKVFEDTFPDHRCIRLATRRVKGATVYYRATVFNPVSSMTFHQLVGGESVATPDLYHLELDADGKVIEETLRPVLDLGRLPKAVVAAYEKWNPKGVMGQELWWLTEVPREQARVYRVQIIVSAVKAYRASFREDGTVVAADPVVVP